MWFLKFVLGLAAAYAAIVVLAYLAQTWLLFPTALVGAGPASLPPGASRFTIPTPDGVTLAAVRVPAERGTGAERPLLLGFGGNGWNAEAMAVLLHYLIPDHDVVVAFYRGYRPSGGRPGAAALMADALTVHDHVAPPSGVVAVGFSIGSAVATRLAAERPVAGLVLVTPFDSLAALAAGHYPWLPVRAFLRHRMETVEDLARVTAPVAVITASRDVVVPAGRSGPVRAAARRLVYDEAIGGAGHNDIYDRHEFATAMQQAIGRIEGAGGP